jgi:hypothetical protein
MQSRLCALAVLIASFSSAFAEFPIGTWSNKKEGFYIVNLSLRGDGKGCLSAATAQATVPVRWRREGGRISIEIAAPPQNPTATLVQTADPKAAELTLPEQKLPEKVYLVDENEPPDLEALSLAKATEEAKKAAKGIQKSERTAPNIEALLQDVQSFAQINSGMGNCSISSSKWPTFISLIRTNSTVSVTIQLDASRSKTASPAAICSYTKEEPKTDLPKTIYVPAEKRDQLKTWAISKGLDHEFAFYQTTGPWGVESYFSFFAVTIVNDPAKVVATVKHLASDVFNDSTGPFLITEFKRK